MLSDAPRRPLDALFDVVPDGLPDTKRSTREPTSTCHAAAGDLVLAPDELARLLPTRTTESVVLTPRELEVLHLVAEGLTNKEIAQRVIVSLNTVRKHVQAVLTKLDAHSKLEAVIIARRRGIIDRF